MKRLTTAAVDAVRVTFFAATLTAVFTSCTASFSYAANYLILDDAADRLFDRAGQAQNNGDFEFAAELWDKFLQDFKDDPQALKARHYSGVCRMTLKQFDKAANAFGAVIADKKADQLSQLEESYYYLGWCLYSSGQSSSSSSSADLTKAIKTFDSHIAKFEKGKFLDQVYFLKGESLYFLGKKKDSIKAYQKVVTDFPKSTSRSNAIYALGVSQFEIKEYDAAESAFNLFLEEFKDNSLANEIRLFRAESRLQQANSADEATKKSLLVEAQTELKTLGSLAEFEKRDEALYHQALCASQLEDYDEAARLYAEVADEFGKSPFANASRLAAGKLYLRLKDYPQAEKWLKASAENDPAKRAEANHWYCQALLRQNRFEDALVAAEKALESEKEGDYQVRLLLDLGDAQYAIDKQKAKSIATYRKIAEYHPDHPSAPQALYNGAFACLELQELSQGLELTSKFVEKYQGDSFLPDVLYVRAECFLLSKKSPDAEMVYRELIKKHANRAESNAWRVRLALCLYLQNKYEPLIEFLSKTVGDLKDQSQLAEANFLIGASHYYQGNQAKAIDSLEQATSAGNKLKQLDEGLVLLAQSYAKQDDYKRALASLDKLRDELSSSRYSAQANYLSGQYLSQLKEFEKAIASYQLVTSAQSSTYVPFALLGKGWAQRNLDQNADAVKSFTQIIDQHSDHELKADAYYGRAVASRSLEKFDAVVTDIDRCLQAKPDFKNRVSALYEKGMALSSSGKYAAAGELFKKLLQKNAEHKDADEFQYQLAWAYQLGDEKELATQAFDKLSKDYPDSPVAAESHYHVAEDLYRKKRYEDAIERYDLAVKIAKSPEIVEKANYKGAWSHYQNKDFEKARAKFGAQLTAAPKGDLADSARFMTAESWYQQDRFNEAFQLFSKALPDILASEKTSQAEKSLACLHAAESANQLGKFDEAKTYIKSLQNEVKSKDYEAEAWLELGNAQRGLTQLDAAVVSFNKAFDLANNETGARAGFLVGEVYFQQKEFEDAIRQYKLVIYGYGGSKAPENIKKWQCSSGYEAARCYHVQIKGNSGVERQKLIADARKFYGYVVQNHPQDRLAVESKKQLAVLAKLK